MCEVNPDYKPYVQYYMGKKVLNVPGAYLQTEIPAYRLILLCIIHEFVDIMCEVNPDYKPNG